MIESFKCGKNKVGVFCVLCVMIPQSILAATQEELKKSLDRDIQYYRRIVEPAGLDARINFSEKVIKNYQNKGLDSMYLIPVKEKLEVLYQEKKKKDSEGIDMKIRESEEDVFKGEEKMSNIAVLDFEALNVSKADAVAISEFVRTALVKTKKFNILERNSIERVLAEQSFQQTGCTTIECAIRIGKILNVQKAIIGSYSKVGDLYFITANIVDIETTKITDSERVQFRYVDDIDSTINKLVFNLIGETIPKEKKRTKIQKYVSDETMKSEMPRIKSVTKTSKIVPHGKEKIYYEVLINKGYIDGIEARTLHNVISENMENVAKVRITETYETESRGTIYSLKENVYPGYYLQLKFRKKD